MFLHRKRALIMFVTVITVKEHSANGAKRQVGDKYTIRRQQAKILEAVKKVTIVEDTESPSPSVAPKARVEVPKTPVQAIQPATSQVPAEAPAEAPLEVKALTAAETPAEQAEQVEEAKTENNTSDKETENGKTPATSQGKPKGRTSKYGTKVMTAKN
jgi:hypothetical protein